MHMTTQSRSRFSVARVEAYTDGVFAIAATLLVLDLTTKAIGEIETDAQMWAALAGLRENVIAFVVSFLLLSMLWVIHLQQFRGMARADGMLLWINNLRLLFIVLIPFTTSLVAEYSDFYAGRMLLPINFFFAALLGAASWWWAASSDGHLLDDDAKKDAAIENWGGISAVICGAVAAVASPWLGSWAFLAYVFNEPLTRVLKRRARRRVASASAPTS